MPTLQRSRSVTGAVLIASLASAALGGCQLSGSANGTSSPSIQLAPQSPAPVVDGGTITLTDDGCTWASNPGSTSEGRLTLSVRNDTDDYGLFIVHKLHPGRTFDEGRALISAIQDALKTGAEWPEEISDAVTEATAEAGQNSDVAMLTTAGTFGVVCSANTSPTGDILTVFLVGPLEVTRS
ncbi:MAG: hypothetical protein K0S97_2276 [Chloroflexota bacterium]|jgi:hypothetical protein|nr:hypothetical protein [Chloroflexota bacterium]